MWLKLQVKSIFFIVAINDGLIQFKYHFGMVGGHHDR